MNKPVSYAAISTLTIAAFSLVLSSSDPTAAHQWAYVPAKAPTLATRVVASVPNRAMMQDIPIDVAYSIPVLLGVAMGSARFRKQQAIALRYAGGELEGLYHPVIELRHYQVPETPQSFAYRMDIVSFETDWFFADAAQYAGYIHVYIGPAGRSGYGVYAANFVPDTSRVAKKVPLDWSKLAEQQFSYWDYSNSLAPAGPRLEPEQLMLPNQRLK